MTATSEQQNAVDLYRAGGNLTLHAVAGAGKTTTLRLLADVDPQRRGLYVAFNRSVAQDAKRRFAGTAVTASTMHALAYPTFGRPLEHRLRTSRPVFSSVKQQTIGLPPRYRFPASSGATNSTLTSAQVLRLVEDTVAAFIHSPATVIAPQTVPVPASLGPLTPRGRDDLTAMVAHFANRYWADQISPTGTIRPTHDSYLKLFQLSEPNLPYEYVMLDEAQDSDPTTIAILNAQRAQLVAVGDENQAIYQWRGAINAMGAFNGAQAVLSQSWRFGDAIADAANEWLAFLGSELRAVGRPGAESSVWPSKRIPEAVLCRSNGGVLWEVVDSQLSGVPTAVAGERKTQELVSLAQAAIDLQTEGKTRHPELDMFSSWDQAVAFADTEDGAELSPLVATVDRVGAQKVLSALHTCVPVEQSRTTVSTAHVAKGLEWTQVRLAGDFTSPKDYATGPNAGQPRPMHAEQARLIYVAATRAIRHLDASGIDWFADYKARGGALGVDRVPAPA